jgi:hypothetical protein
MAALNYDDLRTEFRLGDDYDPWGHCMHWLFTIADHLYWNEGETPAEWQFRPSPIGPQNDPDDYVTEIVSAADTAALIDFGNVLNRYAALMRAADMDY